jgi:kynureninase
MGSRGPGPDPLTAGGTRPDWARLRTEFPTLARKTYLSSCSLCLLSDRVRGAVNRYMDLWNEYGASAWVPGWIEEIGAVRREFASVINAEPDEIAVMPSISACLAAISSSLDLSEGDQVVTTELDFPTIAQSFLARARTGVETRILRSKDRVRIELDQFESAIGERTAIVATSRVHFTSGYIQDVEAVASMAHKRGRMLLVDDYQATGQVPIDVKATGVDILLSGGLKWLLGGPGIAYMYVRRDLVPQLSPTVAGWFGNRDQFSFNPHELVFRDEAARFETGTPSVAAVYSGAEGLRIVNELSPEAIRERTSEIASHLVTRLRDEGFVLRTPDNPERHASITMVEVGDPQAVVAGLAERDVIVDARPGAVRISPYFYNNLEDIETAVSALTEVRKELGS